MPDWLAAYLPEGWTATDFAVAGLVLMVVMALVSLAAVGWFVVRLPADYFASEGQPDAPRRNRTIRVVVIVLRNLAGLFLIALGIVLSLPGVPGQGLLTILMGVMLLDFPGKRRFERWIAGRRGVLGSINKLRARFGKPPMLPPSDRQDAVP